MMNTQIDSQRNWIFDDIIELTRLDHSRREAIENAVKRGVFDEKSLGRRTRITIKNYGNKLKKQSKTKRK